MFFTYWAGITPRYISTPQRGYSEWYCFSDCFFRLFVICIYESYWFLWVILYPVTLLKVFVSCGSSLVEILGPFTYAITSSGNKDTFTTGVIPLGLPLCTTWSLFLAAFYTVSLFCLFNVLIIMYWGKFLFWYILFAVLYDSCTFLFRLEKLSSIILFKMFSVVLAWVSSCSSIPIICRFFVFS